MIWRGFKHVCRFNHNVPPAEWLEDQGCLTPHEHGFDPNPLCAFEISCATEKIIDFKVIKKYVLEVIRNLAVEVKQEEEEDAKGFLMEPAYYDFGTITTEELIDDIKKLVYVKLEENGFKPIRVQVRLNETRKYFVWDDGVLLPNEIED
jgi:hypothetical protein